MIRTSVLAMRFLKYAAACGVLAGAACSTPVPAVSTGPVAANAARIWFYQDGSPSDGLGTTLIRVNGNPVGQSQINVSFFRDVPPGHYRISVDNPTTEGIQGTELNLAAGQVAYVKVATLDNWDTSSSATRGGGGHTSFYIWNMPPAMGGADIARIPYRGG